MNIELTEFIVVFMCSDERIDAFVDVFDKSNEKVFVTCERGILPDEPERTFKARDSIWWQASGSELIQDRFDKIVCKMLGCLLHPKASLERGVLKGNKNSAYKKPTVSFLDFFCLKIFIEFPTETQ